MESHLEEVEAQTLLARDHYLAVEDASFRKLRLERSEQLGEIAVERLLVAALDEDVVAIPEDQGAKAIPFGLEDPPFAGWKRADPLGEHRQNWWIDSEVHGQILPRERIHHYSPART